MAWPGRKVLRGISGPSNTRAVLHRVRSVLQRICVLYLEGDVCAERRVPKSRPDRAPVDGYFRAPATRTFEGRSYASYALPVGKLSIPGSHLPGQAMPSIGELSKKGEKLLVVLQMVSFLQVIRVCQRKHHAMILYEPFRLLFPDGDVPRLQLVEEDVVLWNSVRQLNELPDNERPNRPCSARKGLVRVIVEARGVVQDVQMLQPFEIAMNLRRPESHGAILV